MAFLGLVRKKGLFGITWGTPGAETWDYAYRFEHGLSLDNSNSITEPYARHAVVATAISTFVGDAASVDWELYPEGRDDDQIESHPILDFFDKPNPNMSGYQLWIGTYLSLKIWGEAFWYYPDLTIGGRGGLRATSSSTGGLALLDPRKVKLDMTGGRMSWKLHTLDGDLVLDPEVLTQFKRPNPYNPYRGLSELESLRVEIDGDAAAADYNRRFFAEQGGVPSGFLIPSETMPSTVEERDEFAKRMNRSHESGRKFIATIPPGWTWQDIGVTTKDMEFRALREYSREQILAVFGVPPFMAGVLDKANYANAREQRETYWLGTITRFLTMVQQVINYDFLPKVGVSGVLLYPDWESVKSLTENLNEKVDVAAKLFAMGWPKRAINERLELGMDVDSLEDADIGYIPFNVMPTSFALDPPQPQMLPEPTDEEEAEDDTEGDNEEAGSKALPDPEARERQRTLIWRNIIARTRDIEIRFASSLRKHFRDIEQEVLANLNGLKGWKVSNKKGTVEDLLFDLEEAVRSLIRTSEPLHKQAIKRGGESVLSDLDLGLDFDMLDPRVVAKVTELTGKIKRIDKTIEQFLRQSLAEGVENGESIGDLAKRVRAVMDASKSRSLTIARTETGFAYNSGRNIAMQEAGVQEHEWVTARDMSVRDSHQLLDGQRTRIGEPFTDKSGRPTGMLYPQDPSAPAAEVINCRCVALPVTRRG